VLVHLEEVRVVTTRRTISFMSYALFDSLGTIPLRRDSIRSGGSWRRSAADLHVVRGEEGEKPADRGEARLVVVPANCATPLFVLWVHGAAQLSNVTSSFVTSLITFGPVTNIWLFLDHDHEVGDGGGVDGAAGRRAP